MKSRFSRTLAILTVAGSMGTFAGCESLKGPGFEDKSLDKARPVEESAGKPWGFSTKAQEIERNLGYR